VCKLSYTLFHMHFRLQTAIFNFPPTHHVRFKCFQFSVRHFDFRLNSHRIVHRAMLLSAAVTSASSKANAAMLNLLPKVIYALWFSGHQVCQIFTKNHPHRLHFRWRNSKTLDYFENLVGILLPSCIQSEICLNPFPVTGRHLRFPTSGLFTFKVVYRIATNPIR